MWNQTEQKVNELAETNNSLIAALESNKEDTSAITELFGGLYADYQNVILLKESLELQLKSKKTLAKTAYIATGAATATGLGLWLCGRMADNEPLKYAGIGLTFGGGVPLVAISVTDLISRLKR